MRSSSCAATSWTALRSRAGASATPSTSGSRRTATVSSCSPSWRVRAGARRSSHRARLGRVDRDRGLEGRGRDVAVAGGEVVVVGAGRYRVGGGELRTDPGLAGRATVRRPTSPTSTATDAPSCSCAAAGRSPSAGGSATTAGDRGAAHAGTGAAFGRPPDGGRPKLISLHGERHRARRAEARHRQGSRHRRVADPRLRLADPRRPRGAAAHRRRADLRRLGLPQGRAELPHARLALSDPHVHEADDADRPVLLRSRVPVRRAVARRRRHAPVRPVPRHPRRAGVRLRARGAGSGSARWPASAGTRR